MTDATQLATLAMALLAIALLTTIIFIIIYLRRVYRVGTAVRRHTALANIEAENIEGAETIAKSDNTTPPPASVIVYSRNRADNLATLLPQLLSQVYAPWYEVIVVNDGESPETTAVVDALRNQHKNLYLTFTPDTVRNLSRKKLAMMLGIKAAHNPVVVNITGDVRIESTHWLARMMRRFVHPEVEMVLGYSLPVEGDDTVWGKRTRSFDHMADAVTWLTAAMDRRAFRGTEYNIAYTREMFFNNRGFSRFLNLQHGDDDIFVHQTTNRHNTYVELSQQSFARCSHFNPAQAHAENRRNHRFTRRFISTSAARVMAVGLWCGILSLLFAIAGAAVGALPHTLPQFAGLAKAVPFTPWPDAAIFGTAAAIVVGVPLSTSLIWRRTSRALHGRTLTLSAPWLAFTYPWRQLLLTLRTMRNTSRHYTWHS